MHEYKLTQSQNDLQESLVSMNSLVCIKRVSTRLETGGGGVTVTDNCKTATTITCKHKPNRQVCASGRFFKHRNIHTCSACSWIQRLTGCARTFCIHETEEVNADKGAGGGRFLLTGFFFVSAPPTGHCDTSPSKSLDTSDLD